MKQLGVVSCKDGTRSPAGTTWIILSCSISSREPTWAWEPRVDIGMAPLPITPSDLSGESVSLTPMALGFVRLEVLVQKW